MTTYEPPEPNNEIVGGPEDGHRFRFSVSHAGSWAIVGQPHHDADWFSDPWTVEVRAWSLPEAVAKLNELDFQDWVPNHYLDDREEPSPYAEAREPDMYDVALRVTDEALGEGTYAQMNRSNANPMVQAAIARAAYSSEGTQTSQ